MGAGFLWFAPLGRGRWFFTKEAVCIIVFYIANQKCIFSSGSYNSEKSERIHFRLVNAHWHHSRESKLKEVAMY